VTIDVAGRRSPGARADGRSIDFGPRARRRPRARADARPIARAKIIRRARRRRTPPSPSTRDGGDAMRDARDVGIRRRDDGRTDGRMLRGVDRAAAVARSTPRASRARDRGRGRARRARATRPRANPLDDFLRAVLPREVNEARREMEYFDGPGGMLARLVPGNAKPTVRAPTVREGMVFDFGTMSAEEFRATFNALNDVVMGGRERRDGDADG